MTLKKLMAKVEKQYETACPVKRKRLMKKYTALEKRLKSQS